MSPLLTSIGSHSQFQPVTSYWGHQVTLKISDLVNVTVPLLSECSKQRKDQLESVLNHLINSKELQESELTQSLTNFCTEFDQELINHNFECLTLDDVVPLSFIFTYVCNQRWPQNQLERISTPLEIREQEFINFLAYRLHNIEAFTRVTWKIIKELEEKHPEVQKINGLDQTINFLSSLITQKSEEKSLQEALSQKPVERNKKRACEGKERREVKRICRSEPPEEIDSKDCLVFPDFWQRSSSRVTNIAINLFEGKNNPEVFDFLLNISNVNENDQKKFLEAYQQSPKGALNPTAFYTCVNGKYKRHHMARKGLANKMRWVYVLSNRHTYAPLLLKSDFGL